MHRSRLLESCLAIVMAMLVVVVFAQVVLRYLTDQPLAWTEEVARVLFVWACLLGAAVAAERGAHFTVDFVVRRLHGRRKIAFRLFLRLVEATFYGGLAWSGWLVTRVASFQHSSSLGYPMSVPYAAIPICSALMCVFTLRRAYRELAGGEGG